MLGLYPLEEWINWILLMMEKYDITLTEIGKYSNLSEGTVCYVVNGLTRPRYDTLKKICDGVSDIVKERKGEI